MTTSYVTSDPVNMQRKIQEALTILSGLGMPRAQRNDRSALTLLALLDLKPGDPWSAATDPLMGITPIMDFVATIMAVPTRPTHARRSGARPCISLSRRALQFQILMIQNGLSIAPNGSIELPRRFSAWSETTLGMTGRVHSRTI